MKSKIFITALLSVLFMTGTLQFVHAQTPEQQLDDKPDIYWLYDNVYRMATKYNDFQTAASAMYSLISIEPQNDSLRFNLAYLYFDGQKYPSAVLVCMDLLQLNPNHIGGLEISGFSYEALGIRDKALSNFEKLFTLTENTETLYKVAFLQYDVKRYIESFANVEILLTKPEIDEITMSFQLAEEVTKEYSLRVAILNLKGLVYEGQGNIDGAKKAYNDALALAPDFVYAQTNLDKLNN